jgi:hypothetical protein
MLGCFIDEREASCVKQRFREYPSGDGNRWNKEVNNLRNYPFLVEARTIGQAWLEVIRTILEDGWDWFDEGRALKEVIGLRVVVQEPSEHDEIIGKYGVRGHVEEFERAFFTPTLWLRDVDVRKNFEPWQALTYWPRLHALGIDQVEKVIERLSSVPESKRAVISVLLPSLDWNMDYMPCIDIMHFMLRPGKESLALHQFVYARGLDFGQKAYANMVVLARLQREIREAIEQRRGEPIELGTLDMFVGSAHIYEECYESMQRILLETQRGGSDVGS